MQSRYSKLAGQAAPKKTNLFAGVIAYLNGYTGKDITNEQLKDLVEENGGQIRGMPSARCTHIFVHRNLSASKTEKVLRCRTNKTRFVSPAWAIDSAAAGKRLREADYATPLLGDSQTSVNSIYGDVQDCKLLHPAAAETGLDLLHQSPPRGGVKRLKREHTDGPTSHQMPSTKLESGHVSIRAASEPVTAKRRQANPQQPVETLVIASPQPSCTLSSSHRSTRSRTSEIEPQPVDAVDGNDEDCWDLPPSAQPCKRG